ncbi:nucleotide disphospho-sugar-binding domain-containing protein [Microcoleus sp. Pol12A5]|uniref:nucleotide disphospho-sugar-binding domain-containing protein n=1 Tax=Microcoleus sp. Pol12A5 TaxID=3055392 RepID=UPI002FD06A5E
MTLFSIPDIRSKVINSDLNFETIGETEFPLGSLERKYKQLGEMSGIPGFKFTANWIKQETALFLRELPEALKAAGIEALLVDQTSPAGSTVAELLNLPFITICNALLVNREPDVPPFFTDWSYSPTWQARLRNLVGNFFIEILSQPILALVARQRDLWNLAPYSSVQDFYSPLAQICQLPPEFDFPRKELPQCFHYVGPLKDPSGLEPVSFSSISFPFEKLTGQRLIYASLGTLQNRKWEIFQTIAEACLGNGAQVVISLGNPNIQDFALDLPGSPLVVPYAPHQQLIEKATLVITHAGMNTTLAALSSGVPLVAIPITNEQPGIASRIARTGAGEVVPLVRLNVPRLRDVIRLVLAGDSYKQNALRLQDTIRRAGGVTRAADIIEQAVSTGQPVKAGVR